jgi:hypothetical protein
MIMLRAIVLSLGVAVAAVGALAADSPIHILSKKGTFEDVRDNVKDAVVNRGFVIDYVGHLNDMLERTSEAAQSVTPRGAKTPYRAAEYMHFCSAKLTHELVSASARNIVNCPYVIFVYELRDAPGTIYVGYRPPVGEPSRLTQKVLQKITALLDDIVKEAVK